MSTRHFKEQDQVQGTKKTLITIQGGKLSLETQREDLVNILITILRSDNFFSV